ncbi:hypothetical protein KR032_010733 [Drosophila birchii]|nr:hypothetical protein KR032_010733 [Drosophila birchii]
MLKRNTQTILIGFVAFVLTFESISTIEVASKSTGMDLGLISLSDPSDMCQFSLPLSYSCCQSVTVNMLNDTKKLCLTINASVLAGTVDLTATIDGTSVGKFNLDVKKPPTACLPLISMTGLNMCLKLILSLTSSGAKICPNVYASFNSNDIMTYNFPCAQVGLNGVNLV